MSWSVVGRLLADHETSAAALIWTGWLLATHVAEQDRIADEVRSNLGTRSSEFADLPRLRHAREHAGSRRGLATVLPPTGGRAGGADTGLAIIIAPAIWLRLRVQRR